MAFILKDELSFMIALEWSKTPTIAFLGLGHCLYGSFDLPGRRKQGVFNRLTGAKSCRYGRKWSLVGLCKRAFMFDLASSGNCC